MAGFDRTAAMLEELAGLSDNSTDSIAGLHMSGPHFHDLMGEIREAVRITYSDPDVDDEDVTGDTVVDDQNVMPGDDTLLEVFAGMPAAQDMSVRGLTGDYDTVFDLVRGAVADALGTGVGLLLDHLRSAADDAEAEHEDDDEDTEDDEYEDEDE